MKQEKRVDGVLEPANSRCRVMLLPLTPPKEEVDLKLEDIVGEEVNRSGVRVQIRSDPKEPYKVLKQALTSVYRGTMFVS